jgi:hypothetical protein
MIIRRRCPECGAPVRYAEGDAVTACGYCGLSLAVAPAVGRSSTFVMPPRAEENDLSLAAKRALREAGIHLRSLAKPRVFYLPFYRLRAETWLCFREPTPQPDRDLEEVPLSSDPPPGEIRFRIGRRDLSLAATEFAWGPRSLGFRLETCEVTPLAEEGDLDLLPPTVRAEAAAADLFRRLKADLIREDGSTDQRLFIPESSWMTVYAPLAVTPFRGPAEQGAVVLDGITAQNPLVLSLEAWSRIEAQITRVAGGSAEARGADDDAVPGPPGTDAAAPLWPFSCPACSAPLPLQPEARLHSCPICRRVWSVGATGLTEVATRRLLPARRPADGGTRTETWLPFYRLGCAAGWRYVPGFQGRHPRAVWNFTFALNRRAPAWAEEEESCSPGAAVERSARGAAALEPFLAYCLERTPSPAPSPAELCWIRFIRRGPDWVEPGLGLGFPCAAVRPWDALASVPAAHRG